MSTSVTHGRSPVQLRLWFWAVVAGIYGVVVALGWDQETMFWLHARAPVRMLIAFRVGYAVVGGGMLALLMRRRYTATPLVAAMIGGIAGYIGGLAGEIGSSIAQGPGLSRLAYLGDPHGGPPLGKIIIVLLLPLVSPGWLWSGIGAGLGSLAAQRLDKLNAAGEP